MKNIFLGFSKSNKLGSKIIRFAERSEFSHVYIKWYSEYLDRNIVYHASGVSVGFITFDNFIKAGNEVVLEIEIPLNDKSKKEIIQFCMDRSSIPYGFKLLFGYAIRWILGLFKIKINPLFGDGPKSYICSEIASDVIKFLGYNIDINSEYISPKDLLNLIKKKLNNNNNLNLNI